MRARLAVIPLLLIAGCTSQPPAPVTLVTPAPTQPDVRITKQAPAETLEAEAARWGSLVALETYQRTARVSWTAASYRMYWQCSGGGTIVIKRTDTDRVIRDRCDGTKHSIEVMREETTRVVASITAPGRFTFGVTTTTLQS